MPLKSFLPKCNNGSLCAKIKNDGDQDVTVTVDFVICTQKVSKQVTIPAGVRQEVCVTSAIKGSCWVSVQASGNNLCKPKFFKTLPCS
jgi:hypothetical protein